MMRFADTDSRYVFPWRLLAPYSDTLFHSVADTSNQDDVVLVVPIKMWTFEQCKPVYAFLLDPAGHFDAYRKNRELFDYFNIVHSSLESVRSGVQSVADRFINDLYSRVTSLLSDTKAADDSKADKYGDREAKGGGYRVLMAKDVDDYVRLKSILKDVDGIIPFQCVMFDHHTMTNNKSDPYPGVLWLSVYNGRCVWARQPPGCMVGFDQVNLKDCYNEQTGQVHASVKTHLEPGGDIGFYYLHTFVQPSKPQTASDSNKQQQTGSDEVNACLGFIDKAGEGVLRNEDEDITHVGDAAWGYPRDTRGERPVRVLERVQVDENHMRAMIDATRKSPSSAGETQHFYDNGRLREAPVTGSLGLGFLCVKLDGTH